MENKYSMNEMRLVQLCGLILASVFVSLQNVCSPVSEQINYSDSSIYQYIGHLINIGKTPYIDAFDHKGPVLYLINAIANLLGTNGIWIVNILFIVAYTYAVYIIANRFVTSWWAFAISLLAVTALSNSYWIGNTPDWYATCATTICMYFFMKYFQTGNLKNIEIIVIGALATFCFWQKFTTVGIIGIYCLAIFVLSLKDNRTKCHFQFRCITLFLVTYMTLTAFLFLWLWRKDALAQMLYDYFGFSMSYGTKAVTFQMKVSAFEFLLRDPLLYVAVIVMFCYVNIRWVLSATDVKSEKLALKNDSQLMSITVICIFVQSAVNAMAGREYIQYRCALYPCAIIVISLFLKILLNILGEKNLQKKAFLCGTLIVLVMSNISVSLNNQLVLKNSNGENELLNEIKTSVPHGASIAVASPDDCGIYMWTNTESATTYPYIQADLYGDKNFWNEYNKQLNVKKPSMIVWNNNWDINYYLLKEILNDYSEKEMGRLTLYIRK